MLDGVEMNESNNGVRGPPPVNADDDQTALYDDERSNTANANGHLPLADTDGDLSPEFAGRLQSALKAFT